MDRPGEQVTNDVHCLMYKAESDKVRSVKRLANCMHDCTHATALLCESRRVKVGFVVDNVQVFHLINAEHWKQVS